IVLVGATGDLARKYLWQGFYNLYLEHESPSVKLQFYAAARIEREAGSKKIKEILQQSVKCINDDDNCESKLAAFKSQVIYHKLKVDEDYNVLCRILNKEEPSNKGGRLFYLSVPPSAYSSIAKSIHSHCRPLNDQQFLRVVFEKPFGEDLSSAKKLAKTLAEYFQEEEIFRIDHYLGKTGVQQILKFRAELDEQYDQLWNKNHVDRVEIVLKEKDNCKGRTRFYNQYGVIRDVMQNHMTELMLMVAMEMPINLSSISDVQKKKQKILSDIRQPNLHSSVIAQYKDYRKHCGNEKCSSNQNIQTPTFAVVKLYVDNARWRDVPFIFISGKDLDERTAYIRVVFKNQDYSVGHSQSEQCPISQVVFHIQGGSLASPALVVSNNLPQILKFSDWNLIQPEHVLYGCQGNNNQVFTPTKSHDAYSVLINGVFNDKRDMFIGTDNLLASWRVWTPLINQLNSQLPKLYDRDHLGVLNFTLKGRGISFTQNTLEQDYKIDENKAFLGKPLVSGPLEVVISKLARRIIKCADDAVSRQGVFHMALSGGSSPIPLFDELVVSHPEIPWYATHVWLVDERCVALTDSASNFKSIHDNLLQHVQIPFFNIHPMPVSLKKSFCHETDEGPEIYEQQMKSLLVNQTMDFVLLGAGTDGHVASLFSNSPSLDQTSAWVAISHSMNLEPKGKRMTFTLDFINNAEEIAVLIHGEKKAAIVRKIGYSQASPQLPVMLIQPKHGKLVWYID
ncbi:predicted protein, partial [Nematostella vectensis]